jgi:hypothetical protein
MFSQIKSMHRKRRIALKSANQKNKMLRRSSSKFLYFVQAYKDLESYKDITDIKRKGKKL